MSLFSRRVRLSRFLLPLFLGVGWSLAYAQTRAPKAASAPSSALPLIVGASLCALVVGGLAGASLRKSSGAQKQESDSTFDFSPSPLCEMNASERIERENSSWSALLGTSPATQTTLFPSLHPDDVAPVRAGLLALFEGEGAVFETPARFFRPDGALVTTHLEARTVGKGRRPERILIGLQDASELSEAKRELDGARAAIRALYQVMAGDKTADLNSKIKSLLALGCGRLELPFGALSRLTTFDDDDAPGLETVWVQSPDRRVRPALALRRGDDSLEGRLLGLPLLPPAAAWRGVPCIASQQGATYLAAPVEVNGQWFGMLSFSSLDTTRSGFDASETELLGLMAQWVGSEIEREEARTALEASQREMAEANRKLELLATIDPLTEAKNRRAWNEKLAEEWSRATRYGTPLSLVLLDVDKFKTYNDSFGHQAGDGVLRQVARTAQNAIRVTDFFARYGGEEFALVLPNTDAEGALILAERLRAGIEGAPWKERPVTASFGVATLDGDMKSSDDLTRAADEALYGAKERGRNRVVHMREMTVATTTV